jgi:hypothetical protein
LVLVHVHTPSSKLTGYPCWNRRLNFVLPPVCGVTNTSSNNLFARSKSPVRH